MKAIIRPLNGKYYGTVIELPEIDSSIKLWFASGEPSRRELEQQGYTQQQWDDNELVRDGWNEFSAHIQEIGLICDSHYECAKTLQVAEVIVEALKGVIL